MTGRVLAGQQPVELGIHGVRGARVLAALDVAEGVVEIGRGRGEVGVRPRPVAQGSPAGVVRAMWQQAQALL